MKKLSMITISSAIALALSACAQTDVIAKYSVTSFDDVLKIADVTLDSQLSEWSLNAPDGSARFIFSADFNATTVHDVMIETDAQPFIDAGLDVNKLPDGVFKEGRIMLGQSLGDQTFSENAKSTAIESFKELVKFSRDSLGYHEAMAHYGIDVGNGSKFEWAKDLTANDKDIVYVLDPEIFINAGVDMRSNQATLDALKLFELRLNELEELLKK